MACAFLVVFDCGRLLAWSHHLCSWIAKIRAKNIIQIFRDQILPVEISSYVRAHLNVETSGVCSFVFFFTRLAL